MAFRKGVLWTLLGVGMVSGSQWLIMVLLTNTGNLSLAGDYALALSIVTPLILLFGMSLRAACVSSGNSINIEHAIDFRLISLLLVCVISIVFSLFFAGFDLGFLCLVLLVWFLKSSDQLSDIYYTAPYLSGENEGIGKSVFTRAISSLFVFFLSFYLLEDLLLSMAVCGMTLTAFTVLFDRKYASHAIENPFKIDIALKDIKNVLGIAWALGISSFIVALNSNIPRYFVDLALGREVQGAFSSIAYLILLANLPIIALGTALRPRIAKLINDDRCLDVRNITIKSSLLIFIFSAIFFAISCFNSNVILSFLYGPSLLPYSASFIYASAASLPILLGTFVMFIYTSMGNFAKGLVFSVASLAVTLTGFSYLFFIEKLSVPTAFVVWGGASIISCLPIVYLFRLGRRESRSESI